MSIARLPRYLRVSLLSACNLRCSYCLPPGKCRPTIIAPEDKVRSAIKFLHQSGIKKIRFTGGEPTLYKGLCELVSFVKSLDQDVHTAITSNGVLLGKMAKELSATGLDSINISLDTLNPAKFLSLTGKDYLDRVICGIKAAADNVASVKLNTVLVNGINDDEVEKLITFADDHGLDIRFIEFMPNRYSSPGDPRFISSDEIRRRLPWDFQELPGNSGSASRYYISPSLNIKIGFISSVSRPFCQGCDRLRLTASGRLHTCLYDSGNINLFELLDNDPLQARVDLERLIRSKRIGSLHRTVKAADALPSFSSIGG